MIASERSLVEITISKAEKVEVITINYAYDCLIVIGVEPFGGTFPTRMNAGKKIKKEMGEPPKSSLGAPGTEVPLKDSEKP